MLHFLRSGAGAWRPLVGLAAVVLALHTLLLLGWSGAVAPPTGLAPQGAALRPVVQLLPRDGPRQSPLPADAAGQGLPEALPAGGPPIRGRLAAATPARREVTAPASRVPVTQQGLGASPPSPGPAAGAAQATWPVEPVADPAAQARSDEEGEPAGTGPRAAMPSGEPPPLYLTRWPQPASLRYALHYRGRSGEAVLNWQPADDRYALQLQGLADAAGSAADPAGPAGRRSRARALIEQASQGRLAPHGLVPDRFTDRRGGRSLRAANFRHELGRIEFSGPATVHPDWLGAQDRLSWWVQLPAILAASAVAPEEIRLFVVDVWGGGELWRFEPLGRVALDRPGGGGPVQHWRREPAQPEGQRVEVWLDPAMGFWPVQLRFTSLRNGERIEFQLRSIDRAAG